MTLQPVTSENEVFPIPDLCHTRLPRRAAEKLFPQLDYSMQPPNQELIVRDLHDNLWTFRHIYRGQPKRHVLTTGWSLFVGAKKLKAGDSVLFIRDENSQLLLGVRCANRKLTALTSSVLSADSMHIGVLAAAAHAAASRSPFTVLYNHRACPSEFIIPMTKYHKAAYTQVSIGMRFGMMFETEVSSKRRYMGTIVGISDYDPVRWPNSRWRNLQVEWYEHGYGERPDRVSLWEIETPESIFAFPNVTSSLKRQCLPGYVGPAINNQFVNLNPFTNPTEDGNVDTQHFFAGFGSENFSRLLNKPCNPNCDGLLGHHQSIYAGILQNVRSCELSRSFSVIMPALHTMGSSTQREVVTTAAMQHNFEPTETFQLSCISDSGTPQCITTDIQEYFGTQLNSLGDELLVQGILSSEVHDLDVQGDCTVLQGVSNSYGIMDLFEESNNQGETIGHLHLDPSNESMDMGHVPGAAMDGLSPIGSSRFQIPSVMPVCNFTSNQESVSHITSTRMTDSVFSLQDVPDSSAGTSSAIIAMNDCSLYHGSRKQACQQPLRTYTKVQKVGSVGRSIDVTRFSNYFELRSAVACMFGLEGQLDDPRGSEWKLVYIDYENDFLLVGDDPWDAEDEPGRHAADGWFCMYHQVEGKAPLETLLAITMQLRE
ncbi:auxin response factor 11-like isoform X2 [Musa acuminata AAA Group]|uniref:auxin response factor 11-like isoform X2 n=1 Tax=Musa acuminata AAA Group TaxID=214697 RepID=UPI0031DE5495